MSFKYIAKLLVVKTQAKPEGQRAWAMSKAAGECGMAYAEFETFRLSRSSITCRFWAHSCALQKRLHQMWCTSHSTPNGVRFAKSAQNAVVARGFSPSINGG